MYQVPYTTLSTATSATAATRCASVPEQLQPHLHLPGDQHRCRPHGQRWEALEGVAAPSRPNIITRCECFKACLSMYRAREKIGPYSGRPKENSCLSAESRERPSQKVPFLQKCRKNRKSLFLPKGPISAETHSFCQISATDICRKSTEMPTESVFLPKESISAERLHFCRMREMVQ